MASFLTKAISALSEKITPSSLDVFLFGNNGGNEMQKITYENLKKNIMLQVYPVGCIYESTDSTNPTELFGGTWESYGSGKVLVGIDLSQTEFNSVNKTGGEKTHKLSQSELPKISGNIYTGTGGNGITGGGWGVFRSTSGVFSNRMEYQYSFAKPQYAGQFPDSAPSYGAVDLNIGSDQAHNNLQPYITVYRWRRIS